MKKIIILCALFLGSFSAVSAQEGFIGEVKMFAGNFAPRGWALCQGQLLQINQYQALFSILGTTYGGDGRKTFALPDLRGRCAEGTGTPIGGKETRLGSKTNGNTVYGNHNRTKGGDNTQINSCSRLGINYIICLQGIFPSRS